MFVAGGLDPQQAGIWTVLSFVSLCVGIGYYKERKSRTGLIASTQAAPTGVPFTTSSVGRSQPVYVPTHYSHPIYTPPQPVRVPMSPAGPVAQPRPTPQPLTPVFQPATAPPVPRPAASSLGRGHVVGSRVRSIYHRPSCHWAAKISLRNRRQFSSATDAQNAGFKPCGVCSP